MCQKSLWFRFAALNAAVLLAVVALYGAVDRITHRKGFTISRSQIGTSDPANYLEWSSQVFAGKSPYRDGTLPYPPLAIVPMLVPRLFFSTRLGYTLGYGLLMIGINSALLALIERASIEYHCNPTIALAWYTALVAPIASMVLARLDVIVALVCLWGALELGRGRQGTAGFAVGLGTMFKLVPALVLLPYFLRCLSSLLKKGTDQPVPNPKPLIRLRTLGVDRAVCPLFQQSASDPRLWLGAIRTLSTFLIVCALIGGIAVFLFGGTAALQPFEVQARRGVEFESTYAGIAMAWGKLTHTEFALKFSPYCRCVELSAPATSLLNRISTPVAIAAFGLVSYLLFRFPPGEYARSVSAVLLVFVLTSKVLSPQHLLWIVPFL